MAAIPSNRPMTAAEREQQRAQYEELMKMLTAAGMTYVPRHLRLGGR